MMQKTFPIVIRGGSPKTDRVVLKSPPMHKKYVFVLNLKATPEFVRDVTGRCRDNL
jgi:hypothetical protein